MTNNDNRHKLTYEDKEIVLVGTAHVSMESAELAESVIQQEKPDAPHDKLWAFDPPTSSGSSTCRAYTRFLQPTQKTARLIIGIMFRCLIDD